MTTCEHIKFKRNYYAAALVKWQAATTVKERAAAIWPDWFGEDYDDDENIAPPIVVAPPVEMAPAPVAEEQNRFAWLELR